MTSPVKIILDTDMGPDCDDAAALAVLHALADRGEAHILGITHCTSNPYGAGCIDAINAYCGRPDIPIGTLQADGFLGDGQYQKYNRYIHDHYPHRFKNGSVPDAVGVTRQLLQAEEDGSVVITAIGPLPNLMRLLRSEPDRFSPLNGEELVSRKVSRLVVMGGAFPQGTEWNFQMHPESARYVCENWPTTIMFCGFEIGEPVQTGQTLYHRAPEDHPVRKSYELFLGKQGKRSSWDLTAVLYSVRGLADYWDAEADGYVHIKDSGENVWNGSVRRGHAYLKKKMDERDLEHILDSLLC